MDRKEDSKFGFLYSRSLLRHSDAVYLLHYSGNDDFRKRIETAMENGRHVTGDDIYSIVTDLYYPKWRDKDSSYRAKMLNRIVRHLCIDMCNDEFLWLSDFKSREPEEKIRW